MTKGIYHTSHHPFSMDEIILPLTEICRHLLELDMTQCEVSRVPRPNTASALLQPYRPFVDNSLWEMCPFNGRKTISGSLFHG